MFRRARALSVLLTLILLGSATAEAASFISSPRIQTGPHITNNAAVLQTYPRGYGGPKEPPPIPRNNSNDQFDTNGNLNPGGGGGVKPGKKPNLS